MPTISSHKNSDLELIRIGTCLAHCQPMRIVLLQLLVLASYIGPVNAAPVRKAVRPAPKTTKAVSQGVERRKATRALIVAPQKATQSFPTKAVQLKLRVEAYKNFIFAAPAALTMFNKDASGGHWMNKRANKASEALSTALSQQVESKGKHPLIFNESGALYGDAIFRDSYFNTMQRNAGSKREWQSKQPWLKWDAKKKSYQHSTTGATEHLLSTLGATVEVHRGTSSLEASLWRGTQAYYLGSLKSAGAKGLRSTLTSIRAEWSLTPSAKKKLDALLKQGFAEKATKSDRRTKALSLLELISQLTDEGASGYGAISTTPRLAVAKAWAAGAESGAIIGRKQQASEVISFTLNLSTLKGKARSGLYAGIENGAFMKQPAYLELLFTTPEAKLHALETLVPR